MNMFALEKQVVSLELAKRLKELGIKQQSFFRYARPRRGRFTLKYSRTIGNSDVTWEISAFTIAELGEMLPWKVIKGDTTYWLYLGKNAKNPAVGKECEIDYRTIEDEESDIEVVGEVDADTEADAHAKRLIYLVENGLWTLEIPMGV
jgi:hypothetical protein